MGKVVSLNEYKYKKLDERFKNNVKEVIGITASLGIIPEGFHTYSRVEVSEANEHPFMVSMGLKLTYGGWCIFCDKISNKMYTTMRDKPEWLFMLKPAGVNLIDDIKEQLKHFKPREIK